jgi:hypothetical protein
MLVAEPGSRCRTMALRRKIWPCRRQQQSAAGVGAHTRLGFQNNQGEYGFTFSPPRSLVEALSSPEPLPKPGLCLPTAITLEKKMEGW